MSNKKLSAPNHLLKLFEVSGLVVNKDDLSATEYIQEGIKAKQKSVLETALAGMYYSKARELEGIGFITLEAKKHSISRRTIYNDIDVYELFKRAPKQAAQALAQLDFTKLLQLKRLNNDELADLTTGKEVRGITYDDVVVFPTRELEKRLRDENSELQEKLDKSNKENINLKDQLRLDKKKRNSLNGFDYPITIERIRIDSSIMAAQSNQFIDDMEQLAVELMQANDLSSNKEKQQAEFSAGATSLYLNLKAIQSKSTYLLGWFAQTIGEDYLPDKIEDVPVMSEEEASHIFSMHKLMLAESRLQKQSRDDGRKTSRRKKKS